MLTLLQIAAITEKYRSPKETLASEYDDRSNELNIHLTNYLAGEMKVVQRFLSRLERAQSLQLIVSHSSNISLFFLKSVPLDVI